MVESVGLGVDSNHSFEPSLFSRTRRFPYEILEVFWKEGSWERMELQGSPRVGGCFSDHSLDPGVPARSSPRPSGDSAGAGHRQLPRPGQEPSHAPLGVERGGSRLEMGFDLAPIFSVGNSGGVFWFFLLGFAGNKGCGKGCHLLDSGLHPFPESSWALFGSPASPARHPVS